jgi:membrane protein
LTACSSDLGRRLSDNSDEAPTAEKRHPGLLRRTTSRIVRSHPVSDYALWAAGLTFFAIVGLVPLVLECIASAGRLVGHGRIRSGTASLLKGIPNGHGVRPAINRLVEAALGLSWGRQAVLLFPMSLYGEGLRRAFLQLSHDRPRASTGWRGRLAILPVAVGGPLLVIVIVSLGTTIGPLYARGGWRLVLGVIIAFHVMFVMIGALLVFVYGGVGSVAIGRRALLVGAFGAASFIAGFAQGFLVFLAIPIDWSAPFGGLPVVGSVVALVLWLYAMHLLVLVGYRVALVADTASAPLS